MHELLTIMVTTKDNEKVQWKRILEQFYIQSNIVLIHIHETHLKWNRVLQPSELHLQTSKFTD